MNVQAGSQWLSNKVGIITAVHQHTINSIRSQKNTKPPGGDLLKGKRVRDKATINFTKAKCSKYKHNMYLCCLKNKMLLQ